MFHVGQQFSAVVCEVKPLRGLNLSHLMLSSSCFALHNTLVPFSTLSPFCWAQDKFCFFVTRFISQTSALALAQTRVREKCAIICQFHAVLSALINSAFPVLSQLNRFGARNREGRSPNENYNFSTLDFVCFSIVIICMARERIASQRPN